MPTIPRAPRTVSFGPQMQKAIAFAAGRHMHQFRKRQRGGIYLPYIVHPLEVLKLLWKWETINGVMAQAAILHDILEDTDTTAGELEQHFGPEVAFFVEELTCRVPDDTPHDKALIIKDEYMKSFAGKSVESLVIKIADRFCNVRDFMLTDPRYARTYYDKAKPTIDILHARHRELEKVWGEGPPVFIHNSRRVLEADLSGS